MKVARWIYLIAGVYGILALLPSLVDCVGVWVAEGVEIAMNRCNGASEPGADGGPEHI